MRKDLSLTLLVSDEILSCVDPLLQFVMCYACVHVFCMCPRVCVHLYGACHSYQYGMISNFDYVGKLLRLEESIVAPIQSFIFTAEKLMVTLHMAWIFVSAPIIVVKGCRLGTKLGEIT